MKWRRGLVHLGLSAVLCGAVALALGGLGSAVADVGEGAADAERGRALYAECAGCHQPKEHAAGPRHCGVFGREAASLDDYEYSPALLAAGLRWDEPTLDEFLTSPFTYVDGTKMGFLGLDDPQDRRDLIAYLKTLNERSPECAP